MGDLVNKYKEIIEKKKNFVAPPEPDKLKETEKWLQWKNDSKKGNEYLLQLNFTISELDFNGDQFAEIYKEAYGEKEYNKLVKNAFDKDAYQTAVNNYIEKHPQILDYLSEKERKIYKDQFDPDNAIKKKIVADGKIPKEDYDKIKRTLFVYTLVQKKFEERVPFIEAVEKRMSKEQLEKAVKKLDSDSNPFLKTDKENIQYTYTETVAKIKKNIPKEISDNPKKLKDYLHALDFAADHIMKPNHEYYTALQEDKTAKESLDDLRRNEIFDHNKDTYRGGKYNDLYKDSDLNGLNTKIVKEEKNADFESFKNETLELSDKTKEGIKLILKKMDQMQLHEYKDAETGESAHKIYGFAKLMVKQKALKTALDAEKPNPDEIIKASGELEKVWKDMEEIYQIARTHFSQDQNNFQPNLDSVRNENIPVTFTRDLATTAQINGLYITHVLLHNNNISIDDYLKNPVPVVLNDGLKYYENKGVGAKSKNLSFAGTIRLLLDMEEHNKAGDNFRSAAPKTLINRTLHSTNYLEPDPEKKKNNTVYLEHILVHTVNITDRETAKFAYLARKPETEAQRIARDQTLQNLIVVDDKDRNLDAMYGGHPLTDVHGKIIAPSLNQDEYISSHTIDYEDIIDRSNTMLRIAKRKNLDYLLKDDILEAVANSYKRILTSKQADRGKPGFDKVENNLLNMVSKLTANPKPAEANRLQAIKNRITAQVNDYKFTFRPELKCSELLSDVAAADVHVYNGSKQFDEAWNELKDLNNMFQKYQTAFKSDFADTGKRAHLDAMRQKIQEATAKANIYINYKLPNGRTVDDLDPKPKRRVRIMQEAVAAYGKFNQWITRTVDALDHAQNEKENKYNNAVENALPEQEIYKSDFELYEDPYLFGGKTRSEQLSFIYTKLKEVDPRTLYSHTEFREFRAAFEKFKKYGDEHPGKLTRYQMDTYLKLSYEVKAKAKAYIDRKDDDARLYQIRNHRVLQHNVNTQRRIQFCTDISKMIDDHLTFSSGKRYLKEVGGNPFERALGKWAVIVREEDSKRDKLMDDKEKYVNSVARGMYLERIKAKLETDPNYYADEFMKDLEETRIQNGADEIKLVFPLVKYNGHISNAVNRKVNKDYWDELETGVVNPRHYEFLYLADENMNYEDASEDDLTDLRLNDSVYIRAELKNFVSTLLLARNGQYKDSHADFIKSFGYQISDDKKHLTHEIKYKGEPEINHVDFYVKTETADYSKLSDEVLDKKIDLLSAKIKQYNRLAFLMPENATILELNEVTGYVRERMNYSPVRKAEIALGLSEAPKDLNEAVKEEFLRRRSIYSQMLNELRDERDKARAEKTQREKVKKFYNDRRETAQNLKAGDILRVKTEKEIRTLEVLGIKDGIIYFDDFGDIRDNPSFFKPVNPEETYNKGGISIDEFTSNTEINLVKETTRKIDTNTYKRVPTSGPIERNEFLKNEYENKFDSLSTSFYFTYQDYKKISHGETPDDSLGETQPENAMMLNFIKKLEAENKEKVVKRYEEGFASKKEDLLKEYLKKHNYKKEPVDKNDKTVIEGMKEAEKDARFFINRDIYKKLEEIGYDELKPIAKQMVKKEYEQRVKEMEDYTARMNKAIALYNGLELPKDMVEDLQKEIDLQEKNKKFHEGNNIINDKSNPFESAALDKAKGIQAELAEEARKLFVIKKELIHDKEPKNQEKNQEKIDGINKELRKISYHIFYIDLETEKFLNHKTDLKQYYQNVVSYHKPDVKKNFADTLNSVQGFVSGFEKRIAPFRRTTETLERLRELRDEVIAGITYKMKKNEAKQVIEKLGGRPEVVSVYEKQIREAEKAKNQAKENGKPSEGKENEKGKPEIKPKNMIKP